MKFELQNTVMGALLVAGAMMVPNQAFATSPGAPPPGYIRDVATVHPGVLSSYTQFSTSFVADATSEYVSFAFRETPAYFAFDDAVVNLVGGSTNLLSDPGFESASDGQNCNHTTSLGCPESQR